MEYKSKDEVSNCIAREFNRLEEQVVEVAVAVEEVKTKHAYYKLYSYL